jgi:signal transduction histidine kinase
MSLRFDVPTLLVATGATAALLGILFLAIWRLNRRVPGLARFGAVHLLAAASVVLLGARGRVPDILSITIANALLLWAYGLLWSAARDFGGRRPASATAAIGALVWLAACNVPTFYASLNARVALSTTLLAAYSFAAAMEFSRGSHEQLASRWAGVVLLSIHGLVYAVRGPLVLLWPFPVGGPVLPTGFWFEALTLEAHLHMVGMAFAVLAMAKERAEASSVKDLVAARDAASEASEAKSRFLARMSHELRTPLNSVFGFAQVLAQDPRLTPDQHAQATTLERAGRHLLAIVNDILDLAKIEAGKLELSNRPIMLRSLLESCISIEPPQADSKNIALLLEIAPDIPEVVSGDETRLRGMLLNFLSNAVKFTPAGGQVRLCARRTPTPGMLRFEVADTGPGIPLEKRPLLFRDFSQLDPSPTQEFGSTGLGLAISAALATAMGGEIGCDTGPGGRGSVFWVELPLKAVSQEPSGASAGRPPVPVATRVSTAPVKLNRHVLVVDDVFCRTDC